MPNNNPRGGAQWTDEHIADLAAGLAKGTTYREVAAELNAKYGTGYTKNSIVGKVSRLGLVPINKPGTGPCRKDRPVKPKKPRVRREVVRIISANGNSNAMRAIKTTVFEGQTLRCVEVEPQHVSIMDLAGCKYAYGDGPFTFCNHPQLFGSSYCGPHHALCNEKPRPLVDRRFARAA